MAKRKKQREDFIDFDLEELRNRKKESINRILGHKIKVLPKNKSQQELIDSIIKNQITICSGIAGTGKSYITLGTVINLLLDTENYYQKIYLVKSVTTLRGEELGYLKGDLMEKLSPFMWSFDLNMEKLISEEKLTYLLQEKMIEYKPLAYIRGATIDNAIIILDEAQNVSFENARTLLTRIGDNSKIICIGDVNQIDMKNINESSLSILMHVLQDFHDVGVIEMDVNDENVRNPIIKKLEERFKEYAERNRKYNTRGITGTTS